MILQPLGNFLLACGIRRFPHVLAANPVTYMLAMLNPYVDFGIGSLVLAVLTRMALLSMADLSFVLPITATGYVISALLGRFFLDEAVSSGRWIGVALIFAGTALVGATRPRTDPLAHAAADAEP